MLAASSSLTALHVFVMLSNWGALGSVHSVVAVPLKSVQVIFEKLPGELERMQVEHEAASALSVYTTVG